MKNIVKTKTMTLEALGDHIVLGITHPKAFMIWETELENILEAKKLVGGKNPYMLLDIRSSRGISKEARKNISKNSDMAAAALIVGGGMSRIIGNFMMGLNKTNIPIKLFKDKEDGLKWLNELINKETSSL